MTPVCYLNINILFFPLFIIQWSWEHLVIAEYLLFIMISLTLELTFFLYIYMCGFIKIKVNLTFMSLIFLQGHSDIVSFYIICFRVRNIFRDIERNEHQINMLILWQAMLNWKDILDIIFSSLKCISLC